MAAARQEQLALDERREKAQFFNQPTARGDFEHWSKAAHWTLDEAIALSFGRAPEVVQWERLKGYTKVSPFACQYERRRDLAIRALRWQQLFDPVLPGIFLAWAKRLELSFPEDLERAVATRGHWVGDWKSAYDREVNDHAATREFFNNERAAVADRDRLITQLNEEIAALQTQLEEHKATSSKNPAASSLGSRERESLLKIVIGLAIDTLGFDPNASRSPAAAEIAGILAPLGVPLDEDTVRKYLQEARDLLPGETEKG
jgi:hypothetical protein